MAVPHGESSTAKEQIAPTKPCPPSLLYATILLGNASNLRPLLPFINFIHFLCAASLSRPLVPLLYPQCTFLNRESASVCVLCNTPWEPQAQPSAPEGGDAALPFKVPLGYEALGPIDEGNGFPPYYKLVKIASPGAADDSTEPSASTSSAGDEAGADAVVSSLAASSSFSSSSSPSSSSSSSSALPVGVAAVVDVGDGFFVQEMEIEVTEIDGFEICACAAPPAPPRGR